MTQTTPPTLIDLTDEELLKQVYLNFQASAMEVELARRLEHALDELAAKPVRLEQILKQREA